MNDLERTEFLVSRPRPPNDVAAQFVETRIIASGNSDAVYSEWGGNFVTVEQGKKEEQIRLVDIFLPCNAKHTMLLLTPRQC